MTTEEEIELLKYPIGKLEIPENISPADIQKWITDISELPQLLKEDVEKLTKKQLDTPYRPEGWTI